MRLYVDSNNALWIDNKIITGAIQFIQTSDKIFDILLTSGDPVLPCAPYPFNMDEFKVEKENRTFYSDTDEILSALSYFMQTSSGGSGSGFGKISLTGVDLQTDYPVPDDHKNLIDMNKPIITLNPFEVEAVLLMVGEVKTIRFTTAPLEGDLPTVIYNKI